MYKSMRLQWSDGHYEAKIYKEGYHSDNRSLIDSLRGKTPINLACKLMQRGYSSLPAIDGRGYAMSTSPSLVKAIESAGPTLKGAIKERYNIEILANEIRKGFVEVIHKHKQHNDVGAWAIILSFKTFDLYDRWYEEAGLFVDWFQRVRNHYQWPTVRNLFVGINGEEYMEHIEGTLHRLGR